MHRLSWGTAVGLLLLSTSVQAQEPVSRTRYELPVSNGHGALIVQLDSEDPSRAHRATHFREHLFAAEEPVIDENGEEVWGGNDFEAIYTRDLLYDAYFGMRSDADQRWLPGTSLDLDRSGYVGVSAEGEGGTGVVQLIHSVGELEATQFFFAPMDLDANAFVMAVRVRNDGDSAATDVSAFSLANFHLGFGRPDSAWDVATDIDENGETLEHVVDAQGQAFLERGFAGVVATRAVGDVSHFGTAPGATIYDTVNDGGTSDLADNNPAVGAVDGAVGAFQFELGTIPAGEERWAAVVVMHHGDPFAGPSTLAIIDDWISQRDAGALVADNLAEWSTFQSGIVVPRGASAQEEAVVRQSAAMLRMGQVRESEMYLREFLSEDGEVRRTRFEGDLPGTVEHNGYGAVLASLPPGNWTYAWIRDGAYAIKAMAQLGMETQARDALAFYLGAEAGRFRDWTELEGYDMPAYQMTLVRYYGFGVEETDFNDFGPNLEFDGFGLFLWALRAYEQSTGDTTLTDDNYALIASEIADPIVALVEPTTGLLRPDSSIWETHWNGRERHWTYTNITAVRGLCDAADMAERNGDDRRADLYRDTALDLREAIATRLTDERGAVASNLEELQAGEGYFDAAVLDAIAMGLFNPEGDIAQATLAGLDNALLVDASEVGWSRNDDRSDHEGVADISPWGSDYDSAEWVITDLRGAVATRDAGDAERSDAILDWITRQSQGNYLMVAETFEENTGEYKFNAPMLGFGAGAYSLALFHRGGLEVTPACGAYYGEEGGSGETGSTTSAGGTDPGSDESGTSGPGLSTGATDPTVAPTGASGISESLSGGSSTDTDSGAATDDGGCACTSDPSGGPQWLLLPLLGVGLLRRRRPLP